MATSFFITYLDSLQLLRKVILKSEFLRKWQYRVFLILNPVARIPPPDKNAY